MGAIVVFVGLCEGSGMGFSSVAVPWRLFLFLEFDDHDLHGLVARVDVGVHGVGRHGGKPVGFSGLPDVGLDGAGWIDDVHGAAGERDDDSGMIVVVHGCTT